MICQILHYSEYKFLGLGRRRRSAGEVAYGNLLSMIGHDRFRRAALNTTEFTKFKENIEYTVIMPGQYDDLRYKEVPDQCKNFVMISGLLAGLLALSTIIVSIPGINLKWVSSNSMFYICRPAD